jgi:hypothetical protein
MALWTDLIDPATLTGYARESLADYEARRGTLARWLPNRFIPDIVARFIKGRTGLVDVAKFRAYDADLEPGRRQSASRVTMELPALGQWMANTEYEQLRARGGSVSDQQTINTILATTDLLVRSVADSMERLRGITIDTGIAALTQDNYRLSDDFGRPAALRFTASALWSVVGTDRISQMTTWQDLYRDGDGSTVPGAGQDVGSWVMSTRALRSLVQGTQFATVLAGGGSRPATVDEVRGMLASYGVAPIELNDRRVSVDGTITRVLPDDRIYALPAPVDPDDFAGTELGGTFWGRTLSSLEAGWGIEDADQPGIVTGVYRNEKPPMGVEVFADAIGEPVLANADLSMSVKVL